jgi:hypothetical protein
MICVIYNVTRQSVQIQREQQKMSAETVARQSVVLGLVCMYEVCMC